MNVYLLISNIETHKMVKNTKGGNKSKAIARKHITGAKEQRLLRLSTCDLEKYGVVTRVLGNGMFYVVTDIANDKQPQLLGHIRNKFRGRSKRDNTIALGSVVLVGLREWEDPNYKECDLLEVYDPNEVRQMMKNPTIDLSALQCHIDTYNRCSTDAAGSIDMGGVEIEFTEERDYMDGLIPDAPSAGPEIRKEEIVDIDDL
jgi:translation initiation factor IF-1